MFFSNLKYRLLWLSFVVLVQSTISSIQAQQKGQLLLMNGKLIEVENLNDTSFTNLQYRFDKNQFKRLRIDLRSASKQNDMYRLGFESEKGLEVPVVLRDGAMDRDAVFSFQPTEGDERVYYFYDEPLGNVASEEEMRAFVVGERDARFGVTGNAWFYGGMAVGLFTGYAARGSVLALAVPPLAALTARIPVVKIKEDHIQDSSYKYNDDYAAGYETYARSKYTRKALLGSAIGTVVGLLSYAIVDNNF
ncbi:hypothetical protein O3Q51_07050 [Cryomorphaceae bacterium 1068]|nr:hypothetical protein [Cryomorphaceae bacterium 1068]